MNTGSIIAAIRGTAAVLQAIGEVAKQTSVERRPDGKVQRVLVFSVPFYDRARVERRRARRAERRANRRRDAR